MKMVVKYWHKLPGQGWGHHAWKCPEKRVDVLLGDVV